MRHYLKINPPQPLLIAAVLIPIIYQDGKLQILLTQRTQSVKHHKGQVCFPGGMRDAGDKSLWHTALRETQEEINLHPGQIHFIHELPPMITTSSFEISPHVGFVHSLRGLKANPHEIKEIFSVPLDFFRNPDHLRFEQHEYFGQSFPVPFFRYGPHDIWGATGRVILTLIDEWYSPGSEAH